MKYTAYKNRAAADVIYTPENGSCAYTGRAAEAVGYIEKAQLLDPALWALFVEQFRIGNVDDRDWGWRCEYWGKMMRGACFTYAYTQNPKLYRILEDTVRDLLTVQDAQGRFSTYSPDKEFNGWDMWGRKYILLGIQYFLEICTDDALADAAVAAMCRHADYIMAKVGPGEGQKRITETSKIWNGLNSSSILEPFVRLYNLTGDEKYLNYSRYIISEGGTLGFDIFEAALEGKLHPYEYPVTKAYEMISNFEGIIEYYRVTGEEKYRRMAVNFARLVMESDITVIGSAGTTHELFDHSAAHQFDPKYNGIMQETCVTVTWMKFCYQMLLLTGESVYADQIERSTYNALLGAINVNHHRCSDQVFDFDSYSPLLNGWRGRKVGGHKDIIRDRFWWGCCVAIGAAGTGLIPMTAVMPARNGVAVNLYLPGDSRTRTPDGTTLCLHTVTDYPADGKVRIEVEPAHVTETALYLRIPAWSRDTVLRVNGREIPVQPGTYARVRNIWKSGDVIELIFDMSVTVTRAAEIDPDADAESVCHAALQRGPVMLARDSQFGEDIRGAVTLTGLYDGGRRIAAEPADPAASPFPAEQLLHVPVEGGYITVADYPSCGQNWDAEKPVTVWITTK